MTHLSLQLRSVYRRGLYSVLLPLVFAATWFECAPQDSRDNAIKSVGAFVLMTIGLACAAATGDRL